MSDGSNAPSPPLAAASEKQRKRQRAGRVCTACRQAKARCDAAEKFPGNCSRCEETSQHCRIDPRFKRTRRIPKVSQATAAAIECAVMPNGSLPQNELPETTDSNLSNLALCDVMLDSFTIGDVALNSRRVTHLFDLFFDRYHPHCPILLERRQPAPTYIKDRFLFWSILSVAGLGLIRDPAYGKNILTKAEYVGIMNGVQRMAGDLGIWPSRDVGTVQGLVILAHWSLPSFRNKDNRALHYINMAIELGMQMGFHRPFHSFEYTSRLSSQATATSTAGRERSLLWIATYSAVQFLSAEWGLPAQIREDWVIIQASAMADLGELPDWLEGTPRIVLQRLAIAKQLGKGSTLFGNSPDTSTGQADLVTGPVLWSALREELRQIELSTSGLDAPLAVLSLWTLFRHCCFGLQMNFTGARRVAIVAELYKYGLQIMDIFDNNEERLAFWPTYVLQIAKPLAVILLRLASSTDGVDLDIGPILQAVSTAYRLLLRSVMFPNDRYHRHAKSVAFTAKDALDRRSTGQLYGSAGADGFGEVKTRIGTGNYNHECLATVKRIRGHHTPEYGDDGSVDPNVNPGFWPLEAITSYPEDAQMSDQPIFNMDDLSDFDNLLLEWNCANVLPE